jgi:hypothetical protein
MPENPEEAILSLTDEEAEYALQLDDDLFYQFINKQRG